MTLDEDEQIVEDEEVIGDEEIVVGRPRNPNKPPALKPVRCTERTYRKILSLHQGQEPYGNTIERLCDTFQTPQIEVEILQQELIKKEQAFDRLYDVHEETKKELAALKELRNPNPQTLK